MQSFNWAAMAAAGGFHAVSYIISTASRNRAGRLSSRGAGRGSRRGRSRSGEARVGQRQRNPPPWHRARVRMARL